MDMIGSAVKLKHTTDLLMLMSGILGNHAHRPQQEWLLAQAFPKKKPIKVRGTIIVELDPGDSGSARADLRGVTKLVPDLEYHIDDPEVWLELEGDSLGMRFFSGSADFPKSVFVLKASLDPKAWRANLTTRGSGFFVWSADGWIKLGFA